MKSINCSELRRRASNSWIKTQTLPLKIVSGRKREPVAVLLSYDNYVEMQRIFRMAENLADPNLNEQARKFQELISAIEGFGSVLNV